MPLLVFAVKYGLELAVFKHDLVLCDVEDHDPDRHLAETLEPHLPSLVESSVEQRVSLLVDVES